jgi:hypothetical protein
MHIERIGYLGCKLYQLGWRNALFGTHASIKHWLFNIFLHYRRGFTAGVNYVQKEYRLEKKLRQ